MLEDKEKYGSDISIIDVDHGERCYQFLMRSCNECDGVRMANICPNYFPVSIHGLRLIETMGEEAHREF